MDWHRITRQVRDTGARAWRKLEGTGADKATYWLTRWLFLRLLGLIYLIAFVSLWVQIEGLIGSNGILPASPYLEAVAAQNGPERFWWLPTLCWISAGDGFLHFLCGGGAVLALLLIAGVAPMPSLALLWLFYLSLSVVGREFLSFQWDALLLETGLLAIFLAPRSWLPGLRRETPPSLTVIWLLRWLLFRLMFMSGAVKLLSNDATWWNLTALQVHYQTQPLPTWIGWYAHQLPGWVQQLSCAVMFGIELAVPFLILGPRRCRQIAGACFAGLMLLIAVTGNYCFFNWLTVALCLPLFDDRFWRGLRPGKPMGGFAGPSSDAKRSPLRLAGLGLLAGVILAVSGVQTAARVLRTGKFPGPLLRLAGLVSPLRSINGYGLFAVMTTTRPEIIVEGSNDGIVWRPYEFKWKPGDLERAPAFVAPHQPRLDWQMWFAALGDVRGNPWFVNFLVRLLQGSPQVLALVETNPFPDAPPRMVRAGLYEYRFTDFATRRSEGAWWRREARGSYCPPVGLSAGPAAPRPAQ
jgi:hypothetical protein